MLNPLLISHTLLATTILQLLPISVAAIPTVPKSTTNRAPFNSANEGPIHDYTIEPITFQIPTSPSLNSPTINVTGTIQQAIQAAEKVNPAWRSDFAQATIQKFKSQNLLAAVEVDHWDCSTGAPTGYNDVSESLWAVALTKGKPSLGPGRCGRVSCQEGAAVWWCNNSGLARKELDSYGTITNAAYEILDNCPVSDEALGPKRLIHGQVYLVGEWHVVIGGDEC